MSTLGEMKAHLADDLDDTSSSYATQISRGITEAIRFYQRNRFDFNETRDVTFQTVAGQWIYTSTDEADIGLIREIDAVFRIDDDLQVIEMTPATPANIELLNDATATTSQPTLYAFFDLSFWLSPIPDDVYTIRAHSVVTIDAPATNDEAGNPWMTTAYDLIKARALYIVGAYTLQDDNIAARARLAENEALASLRKQAARKYGTGYLAPTCF